MPEPSLTATRLAGSADSPALLVVGPSLGTSVEALWSATAAMLADAVEVVGWDLPGHGRSAPTDRPFTIADLAARVRELAAGEARGRAAHHAGVSLGGAVALQLALEPGPFTAVACLASAAKIGEEQAWHERADLVRRAGTPVMVTGSAQRWFAPGFLEREPAVADRLLHALRVADAASYARACDALASHDLRDRLPEVRVPLLLGPGELDPVIAPAAARAEAAAAPGAQLHVFAGCAHLPPAEDPAAVAAVLRARLETPTPRGGTR
ncbi:alpha/beta fold hydrolase [Nocardioides nanhaiensis]|uniref:AB hydrolase-1 domain-containing protein n=1 Tax=Nocardioides nanhaiensis TaxID=1476871 RepID=A0ABP8W9Y2_9ACTN